MTVSKFSPLTNIYFDFSDDNKKSFLKSDSFNGLPSIPRLTESQEEYSCVKDLKHKKPEDRKITYKLLFIDFDSKFIKNYSFYIWNSEKLSLTRDITTVYPEEYNVLKIKKICQENNLCIFHKNPQILSENEVNKSVQYFEISADIKNKFDLILQLSSFTDNSDEFPFKDVIISQMPTIMYKEFSEKLNDNNKLINLMYKQKPTELHKKCSDKLSFKDLPPKQELKIPRKKLDLPQKKDVAQEQTVNIPQMPTELHEKVSKKLSLKDAFQKAFKNTQEQRLNIPQKKSDF